MQTRLRLMMLVALGAGAIAALDVACSSDDAAKTTADPNTVSQTVDQTGGSVTLGDMQLSIPAGALTSAQTITIQRSSDATPTGYTAHSPIYRFGPDGLVFNQPAQVSIAGTITPNVAIIWSQAGSSFTPLATTISNGRATAAVAHFSEGFLGESTSATDSGATDGGTSPDGASGACDTSGFAPELTTLAAGTRPVNLVIDACFVYWTDQSTGGLWRVSKNGGAVVQLAASTPPPQTTMMSQGLAIDSTSLYWSESVSGANAGVDAAILRSGDVVRTTLDGGSSTKIWTGSDAPSAVAVDSTYAYVLQRDDLERVPLLGGSATTLANGYGAYGITLAGQRVLWATYDPSDQIRSVPSAGGVDASTFATGVAVSANSSTVVVQDGTNAYWADIPSIVGQPGHVYATPLAGGTQRTLYTGVSEPLGIAFDETYLYVTTGSGGTVLKITIATGDSTPIATGQGVPDGIAVDDRFIYWANNGGGDNGIMRLAK